MNAHGFRSITVTLLLLGTSLAILAASVGSGAAANSVAGSKLVGNKLATVER